MAPFPPSSLINSNEQWQGQFGQIACSRGFHPLDRLEEKEEQLVGFLLKCLFYGSSAKPLPRAVHGNFY